MSFKSVLGHLPVVGGLIDSAGRAARAVEARERHEYACAKVFRSYLSNLKDHEIMTYDALALRNLPADLRAANAQAKRQIEEHLARLSSDVRNEEFRIHRWKGEDASPIGRTVKISSKWGTSKKYAVVFSELHGAFENVIKRKNVMIAAMTETLSGRFTPETKRVVVTQILDHFRDLTDAFFHAIERVEKTPNYATYEAFKGDLLDPLIVARQRAENKTNASLSLRKAS